MGIYKQGLNRKQQLMFPPSLDELVKEDNVVRAIEAYVDTLDIFKLNIKTKKSLIKDGQPAFHPKLLLKIYIYGYLNKIRSSRKLETEIYNVPKCQDQFKISFYSTSYATPSNTLLASKHLLLAPL